MEQRSEISLGDILLAFERLHPLDAESRERLLRMLVPHQRPSSSPLGSGRLGEREELPPTRPRVPSLVELGTVKPPRRLTGALALEPRPAGSVIPIEIQHTRRASPSEPMSGLHSEVLERPPPSLPTMPQPAPLFVPAWQAGIITAALSVSRPEGSLDTARTVPLLARRLPVRAFPRRLVHSMRLGVQVLADVSESMLPFSQDRKQLIRRLRSVVGADRTEVHRFTGVPSRGVHPSARIGLQPFEPPLHEVPLLVLSDLGIGEGALDSERADVREWLGFERIARRAGCRVVVLVPYSPARWPPEIKRHLVLVHWDRHTTARAVLQALQK